VNEALRRHTCSPHFLIVGTPRSGTTLLQRLTSELPGVSIPPETAFFPTFYDSNLRDTKLPMDRAEIVRFVTSYAAHPRMKGLDISADSVARHLDGSCASTWQLFSAIVHELAGDSEILGEKTPEHLRWWRPLTDAASDLKLVAVVRDPRAVVASTLDVPFGMDHPLAIAAQWREDVRDLDQASRVLGPERMMTVRYEDMVLDPPATKARVARFLGVTDVEACSSSVPPIFMSWESAWKGRATGPVDSSRSTAWRDRLTDSEVTAVELVTRRVMPNYGYSPSGSFRGTRPLSVPPARDLARLAHFRWARARKRRMILKTRVGDVRA
jgi:sulfotransferase family protein